MYKIIEECNTRNMYLEVEVLWNPLFCVCPFSFLKR